MIAQYLSAIADHLWQSTLFAIAAGVLTVALRKNRAGARYWLWLAASLKFLVPFSLLSALGGRLAFLRTPVTPSAAVSFAVQVASKPFFTQIPITRSTLPAAASEHSWVFFVLAVWLTGFLAVLIIWYTRWRRVSAAIRESEPLREGREFEALRRIEIDDAARIEMLLSRASLEPGIFGIIRPVMVWPQGISSHLEDAHLEAILTHELRHVRRRDNLAAAVHMVVEAVFWFHPLVWWLGARLVEERERACDEEVLELGGERQVYAESILKVCEFCVGSPLACVAGVTGADLKKRIVHIMTKNVVRKLDFSRKLLLSVAGLLAVALPVGFGLMHATPGRAEAAADTSPYHYKITKFAPTKPSAKVEMIKMFFTPQGFTATGVTLQGFFKTAYKVEDNQIVGAPDWMNSEKFDVEATIDEWTANELKKLAPEQRVLVAQRMLQAFLADQFKLKIHGESKELPIYSLLVAPGGSRLQEAKGGNPAVAGNDPHEELPHGMMRLGPGSLEGQAMGMNQIVDLLSRQMGTRVVDKTGLSGRYDLAVKWAPETASRDGDHEPRPFSGPAFVAAVQEQLGLELEPQQGQVEVVAVDHVERPGTN